MCVSLWFVKVRTGGYDDATDVVGSQFDEVLQLVAGHLVRTPTAEALRAKYLYVRFLSAVTASDEEARSTHDVFS